MTALRSQIESLWFEPGTAADAAAAANKHLPAPKRVSPDHVRQIWTKGQIEGRLPDIDRPHDGFAGEKADLVRQLGRVMTKNRSAA
jgi:hypothetical protein